MSSLNRRDFLEVSSVATLGLLNKPASSGEAPKLAPETGTSIFVSDLSRCQPSTALSKVNKKNHWTLIPYVAEQVSGVMLGAGSMADAPDVTLPLGVSGWHAVYLGFWNTHHDYDGATTIKLKLIGDPCFSAISDDTYAQAVAPLIWNGAELTECFVRYADLTGKDLIIGQQTKGLPKKAYIAYIKLVPLSKEQVDSIQKDRARKETRVVLAANDCASFVGEKGPTTREDILEQVEPYRYSDIGKVIWAFTYGEATNYPSKVGHFVGANPEYQNLTVRAFEKVLVESLRTLDSKGLIASQVALEHVHAMGLQFDAMIRMGVIGDIPPVGTTYSDGLVRRRPELRMLAKDGTPMEKASYAFPEVQEHMLSLIREVAGFDIDGVNLAWIRGPQFVGYEAPVIEDFKKEYGEDPRRMDENDIRVQRLRAKYVTDFTRKVRQLLNELGSRRKRKIELSAWAYSPEINLFFGLDVETWLAEGLLDSLIAGGPKEFVQTVKARNCRFYQGMGDAHAALRGYEKGVDGFCAWDLNFASPQVQALASRLGHKEEVIAFAKEPPKRATVKLKSVGGFDISHPTNRGANERKYWPPEMLPTYSGG